VIAAAAWRMAAAAAAQALEANLLVAVAAVVAGALVTAVLAVLGFLAKRMLDDMRDDIHQLHAGQRQLQAQIAALEPPGRWDPR